MTDSTQFQDNLEKWSRVQPKDAEKVKAVVPKSVELIRTEPLNLCKQGDYFHSLIDPVEEAKRWFNSLNLNGIGVLFVYGVGLGYYYLAAKEWLHQDGHFLVFVEDDLEVLHHLLETPMGKEIVEDRKVELRAFERGEENDPFWQLLCSSYGSLTFAISALAYYTQKDPDFYTFVHSKLSFWSYVYHGWSSEYQNHGIHYYNNLYNNLFTLPLALPTTGLIGKFKGVPAIICGAGPSLDKNLELLESLGDRALIFAGATAMNAVNVNGFLPHFGIGIDPNEEQQTRLLTHTAYEVPYFYRNRLNPGALELIHGKKLYIPGSGGHPIVKWFEQQLGLESEAPFEEGFNVVTFGLSIATALGCNPIILVGLDLAYTNKQSYKSDIVIHPLHTRRQNFHTKGPHEELLIKNDINGQPTYTLWKWISESRWYTEYLATHPNVLFINATEGGIGINGMPNKPLSEVAQHLLNRQIDLRVWVHGEIESQKMPAKATSKNLIDLLNQLVESLARTQNILLQQLDTDEAREKLNQEIGYSQLLTEFDLHYNKEHARERDQIRLDQALTEEEKNAKLKQIEKTKNLYLFQVANTQINLLKATLKNRSEHDDSSQPNKQSHPEQHSKGALYRFDHFKLTLIDEELGLSYSEEAPLISEENASTLSYEDGRIKFQEYTLNGVLHGPVTYYSPSGTVLAQSWYVKGERQGKVCLYYRDGSLYAEEGYKDDKREGTQRYYYQDGSIKTLIHYHDGLLDGEGWLYYANGQPKKEVHFVQGKREGIDRLWTRDGQLKMEAEFHQNKPAKIARAWYPNGVLAQEVVYDPTGAILTNSKWDATGVMLSDMIQTKDYFDQMTHYASSLTESLEGLFKHLNVIAPLMTERSEEMGRDLKELAHSLEQLEEANQHLILEAGLLTDEQPEAIWKSPTVKREMQEKLGEMTNKLQDETAVIRKLLGDSQDKLNKRE